MPLSITEGRFSCFQSVTLKSFFEQLDAKIYALEREASQGEKLQKIKDVLEGGVRPGED